MFSRHLQETHEPTNVSHVGFVIKIVFHFINLFFIEQEEVKHWNAGFIPSHIFDIF